MARTRTHQNQEQQARTTPKRDCSGRTVFRLRECVITDQSRHHVEAKHHVETHSSQHGSAQIPPLAPTESQRRAPRRPIRVDAHQRSGNAVGNLPRCARSASTTRPRATRNETSQYIAPGRTHTSTHMHGTHAHTRSILVAYPAGRPLLHTSARREPFAKTPANT
jgi:hypothetical protein